MGSILGLAALVNVFIKIGLEIFSMVNNYHSTADLNCAVLSARGLVN